MAAPMIELANVDSGGGRQLTDEQDLAREFIGRPRHRVVFEHQCGGWSALGGPNANRRIVERDVASTVMVSSRNVVGDRRGRAPRNRHDA
jgi:hypothetical protein